MSCQILKGDFINVASTPKFIPITAQINSFRVRNLTRSGVTSQGVSGSLTSDRIVEAYFNPNLMGAGTALINQNGTVSGILAPMQTGICAINGCTIVQGGVYVQGPTKTINSFTPGTTTVFVTSAAHGFVVGDNVRIVNMTSAPQMGGLVMTVTAVGSTTQFTTLFNSTNAVTSVGQVYKVGNASIMNQSLYYPQVRFAIPTALGMQQLNSSTNGLPLQFTVSAVNNAVGTQTVTFSNVDSTAFTAFAWPAAASYPFSLPVMIPQGEGNLNQLSGVTPSPLPYANQDILGFATQNQGQSGILIGTGDGTNSATTGGIIGSTVDAWEWEAITASQTFY